MASVARSFKERSLRTTLADLPVLTLFGRKNDPNGWQSRFQQIFRNATAAGLADAHHYPFNDDPDAYCAAVTAWWARIAASQVPLADQHSHAVSEESDR